MTAVQTRIKSISSREKVTSWMEISHGINLSSTASSVKQIELMPIVPNRSVSNSHESTGSQKNRIYHYGSGSRMSHQLPPIVKAIPRHQAVSMVHLRAFKWAARSSKKFVLISTNGCKMVPWGDIKEYFFPWCSHPTCDIVLTALKMALGYPDWAMQVHPCSQREQLRFGDLFKVVAPGTMLVDIETVIGRTKAIWDVVVEQHKINYASNGTASCGADNPFVNGKAADSSSARKPFVEDESSNDSYLSRASEKFTSATQAVPLNTPRESMSAFQANVETLNPWNSRVDTGRPTSPGQLNNSRSLWQSNGETNTSDRSRRRAPQIMASLNSDKLGSLRASKSQTDLAHHSKPHNSPKTTNNANVSPSTCSGSSVQICGYSPVSHIGDAAEPSDSKLSQSSATSVISGLDASGTQNSPTMCGTRRGFRSPIVGLRVNGQAIVPVLFYTGKNGQVSRDHSKWLIPVYLLRSFFPSVQLQEKLTAVYRDFLIGRTPRTEGTSGYARLCSLEEGRDFTRWLYVMKYKALLPDWTIITSKCLLIQWHDFVDYLPFDTIKFFDLDLSTGFLNAQLQLQHCSATDLHHTVGNGKTRERPLSTFVEQKPRNAVGEGSAIENEQSRPNDDQKPDESERQEPVNNVSDTDKGIDQDTPPVDIAAKTVDASSGANGTLEWMPKIGRVFQLRSSKDETEKGNKSSKLSDTPISEARGSNSESVALSEVSIGNNKSSVNKVIESETVCLITNSLLRRTASKSSSSSAIPSTKNRSIHKDNIPPLGHRFKGTGANSKMPDIYDKKGNGGKDLAGKAVLNPEKTGRKEGEKAKTENWISGRPRTSSKHLVLRTSDEDLHARAVGPGEEKINDATGGQRDCSGLRDNTSSGKENRTRSFLTDFDDAIDDDIEKTVSQMRSVSSIITVRLSPESKGKISRRKSVSMMSSHVVIETSTAQADDEKGDSPDNGGNATSPKCPLLNNNDSQFSARAVKKRSLRKNWFQGLRLWGIEDEVPSLNTFLAQRSTVISGEKKLIKPRDSGTRKKIDWHIPDIFPRLDNKRKSSRSLKTEKIKPQASKKLNDTGDKSSHTPSFQQNCSKTNGGRNAKTWKCDLAVFGSCGITDGSPDRGKPSVDQRENSGLSKSKANHSPRLQHKSCTKSLTNVNEPQRHESHGRTKAESRRHSRGKVSKKDSKQTTTKEVDSTKSSATALNSCNPGKDVKLSNLLNGHLASVSAETTNSKRLGKVTSKKMDKVKSTSKNLNRDDSKRATKVDAVAKLAKPGRASIENNWKVEHSGKIRPKSTTDIDNSKTETDDCKAEIDRKSLSQCHLQKPRRKRKRPKCKKKHSKLNGSSSTQEAKGSAVAPTDLSKNVQTMDSRTVCKKEIIVSPLVENSITKAIPIWILEQQKKILEVIQHKVKATPSSSQVQSGTCEDVKGLLKKALLKRYESESSSNESSCNFEKSDVVPGPSNQSSDVTPIEDIKPAVQPSQIECHLVAEASANSEQPNPLPVLEVKKEPFSFQPIYDLGCSVSNRGLTLYDTLVMPYVVMNGYKYVTLLDAALVFRLCQPNCPIARSLLRSHRALHRTMSSWEQVYGFELTLPNRKPPVRTGDMLLRFDTLMIRFQQLEQEIRQKHRNTKLKNSQNCAYVT